MMDDSHLTAEGKREQMAYTLYILFCYLVYLFFLLLFILDLNI